MKLDAGVIGVAAPVSPVFLFSAGGKMKRYILMLLFSVLIQADLFAQQSQNSISIQGRLSSTEAVQGVQVEIFANGVSVSTASPLDLLPDPSGVFTSYISGFDPGALQVPAGLIEISLKKGAAEIARIPLMTVPFALAVRGIKDGDNIVGATGNVGIGTTNPEKKLSVTGDVLIDGDLYARNFVGAVMFFAGFGCPGGWLLADGSTRPVSGIYYPLYTQIGTLYGGKEGEYFNLPLLNDGSFIRGVGGKSEWPGVKQQDTIAYHTHTDGYFVRYETGAGRGSNGYARGVESARQTPDMSPAGGPETRPLNYAMTPCVKY